MKKILTLIAAAVFVIYPSICFASYVIHLKDGREFVTDQYWEEGEQIKFKRYGGVLGIQKELVREIEEKEDVPEEKAEAAKPETPDTAEKAEASEDVVVKEKEARKIDIAYYQKEKAALLERHQQARENLVKARKTRNKALRREAKKELKTIERQQKELAIKLKKENNGRLPPWWHSQAEPK